jgi:hypothetical protein
MYICMLIFNFYFKHMELGIQAAKKQWRKRRRPENEKLFTYIYIGVWTSRPYCKIEFIFFC